MADAAPQRPWWKTLLLWIWWGGTTKPSYLWHVVLWSCIGFLAGVAFDMRFRQIEIVERVRTYIFGDHGAWEMPRPVTEPPPGMAWVKVLTTGYCPCPICCEKPVQDWKTSTNRDIRKHPYGIASSHDLVPPGLWLEVPGYGYAMVDDTGGAMRQDAKRGVVHLDLRFEVHEVARHWGRRWVWIALPADGAAAKLAVEQPAQR
jgi:3D (Asp-Asp-Asp) domain-containing protein